MQLNKEADILQISPTCWSVLAFCFGTCDCSVWCNGPLLPWNPFTGKRHSGRKWASRAKEGEMSYSYNHAAFDFRKKVRFWVTQNPANEIPKTNVYVHDRRHDKSKTDAPKVFWEELFFCGIFILATFSLHLPVLRSISTSSPVFLGLKEKHMLWLCLKTPLHSIRTEGG